MHRIKPQQVRVGFHRAQIVDRHHFDIGATRFNDRAQHIAPDASEPVDCNFDSHGTLLQGKRCSGATC